MFWVLGCLRAVIDARRRGHPSCIFTTILQIGQCVNQKEAPTTCCGGHSYAGMASITWSRLDIVVAKLNGVIYWWLYVVVASKPQNRTAGSHGLPYRTAGSIVIHSAEVNWSGARSYVPRRARESTISTRAHMKPEARTAGSISTAQPWLTDTVVQRGSPWNSVRKRWSMVVIQ